MLTLKTKNSLILHLVGEQAINMNTLSMKTVKEISKITGISIRTLRYYDEIGLLKPARVTEAGYRLYDDQELEKLQEILFYKELEIPLSDIKKIMENPEYDKQKALAVQKSLLERKRNRLNGIIELIDDVMKGVNTMSFGAFTEEDVKKIIDHSLELQSQESLNAIIEQFGSLENYCASMEENLKDESRAAELIKIYGSKDKAVEASLEATGNMDELQQVQSDIDNIYKQFALVMEKQDADVETECVKKLAESYKKLLRVDNARYVLLKTADDYLGNGVLTEVTDKQYGQGVTKYIGEAIKRYYGV